MQIETPIEEEKLKKKARKILMENLEEGYSKRFKSNYSFIKPSRNFYKFQFFWDSCFHVFILCVLGEVDIAKRCFRSLFAMQAEDGFVGHVHYWRNVLPSRITDIFQSRPGKGIHLIKTHMSSLIQPPIVAQALNHIYKFSGDEEFLKEMLPKLKKYYNWLAKNRDFDGDGLLSIITSFESGMDWKPSYDPVVGFPRKKANVHLFRKMIWIDFKNFMLNYNLKKIKERDIFRVKDAGFNTIYVQNLKMMAFLCDQVNDPESSVYNERAEKVTKEMMKVMYDEQDAAFYDVHGKDNKKLKILTPTIFFPVVIDEIPNDIKEIILKKHFFNKEEFHTEYPIPSLAINDPAFNPDKSLYIWRGPTWIVNNWFLHKFLLNNGYEEEAQHLITGICKLINKSGFREYYNPFTGEGHGAHNFTWAALVLDMIHAEKEKNGKGTGNN